MRQKLYKMLKRIYGVLMTISFFAGILPLVPFLIAIGVGGELGANICIFLYKKFYPVVILLGSIAIIIGLVAMYIGKQDSLSIRKTAAKKAVEDEKSVV